MISFKILVFAALIAVTLSLHIQQGLVQPRVGHSHHHEARSNGGGLVRVYSSVSGEGKEEREGSGSEVNYDSDGDSGEERGRRRVVISSRGSSGNYNSGVSGKGEGVRVNGLGNLKRKALYSIGFLSQGIRGDHRASSIFKHLATRSKATSVEDVLNVYLTGAFGAGEIIDSWVPGLGKLFSSVAVASAKINFCLGDGSTTARSNRLETICSNKYGSNWGFKAERESSTYNSAKDYITAYGLDDGLAKFKRLLNTHAKVDLSRLSGSQRVVAQAIFDLFQNGRFSNNYSWSKKDVSFVFSRVITVLAALGSSYHRNVGPIVVDDLCDYSSGIGNDNNGLKLSALKDDIRKSIVHANSNRWKDVIKVCSDDEYHTIIQKQVRDDDYSEESSSGPNTPQRKRRPNTPKSDDNNETDDDNDNTNDGNDDTVDINEKKNFKIGVVNNNKRKHNIDKENNDDNTNFDVDDEETDKEKRGIDDDDDDDGRNTKKSIGNTNKKDTGKNKNDKVNRKDNDSRDINTQDKNKRNVSDDDDGDNQGEKDSTDDSQSGSPKKTTTKDTDKPKNPKEKKPKQKPLTSFEIFWRGIKADHSASKIFKNLSKRPKPTKVGDVLDVYLTGAFGAGAIIDSWAPGLGKLFSSLAVVSAKINYCSNNGLFKVPSSHLGSICTDKYGSKWGLKPIRQISTSNKPRDYIIAYGLDDGLTKFRTLLTTHVKADLSSLSGSQKIVAQAIYDSLQNGRFNADYSWSKKDVTFVFSKVITVLAALGSSYHKNVGPTIVDNLCDYSSDIGNDFNGLDLSSLKNDIKKVIASANSHRWQQVINECTDKQYNQIVSENRANYDDDEDFEDSSSQQEGLDSTRDGDNDKKDKDNSGKNKNKKNGNDKKKDLENDDDNNKQNKRDKEGTNTYTSTDNDTVDDDDSTSRNNNKNANGNDKKNKDDSNKNSPVDNDTTENKATPENNKQPDSKGKRKPLFSFSIFWRAIKKDHIASSIFKSLSKKPKPTKVGDVLDVYLTGAIGAGAIIDSWAPGLGKLFSSLAVVSAKINYCTNNGPFKVSSSHLGSICTDKYGSNWGFKPDREVPTSNKPRDYINAYGLDDGLAKFRTLLNTHVKVDLSSLSGSQKIVTQAIYDILQNGRFNADYSWSKKDVSFVFSKVITVLATLGSSYHKNVGPTIVDNLCDYSRDIGNESNGLDLFSLNKEIKKAIVSANSHRWQQVIKECSDIQYNNRVQNQDADDDDDDDDSDFGNNKDIAENNDKNKNVQNDKDNNKPNKNDKKGTKIDSTRNDDNDKSDYDSTPVNNKKNAKDNDKKKEVKNDKNDSNKKNKDYEDDTNKNSPVDKDTTDKKATPENNKQPDSKVKRKPLNSFKIFWNGIKEDHSASSIFKSLSKKRKPTKVGDVLDVYLTGAIGAGAIIDSWAPGLGKLFSSLAVVSAKINYCSDNGLFNVPSSHLGSICSDKYGSNWGFKPDRKIPNSNKPRDYIIAFGLDDGLAKFRTLLKTHVKADLSSLSGSQKIVAQAIYDTLQNGRFNADYSWSKKDVSFVFSKVITVLAALGSSYHKNVGPTIVDNLCDYSSDIGNNSNGLDLSSLKKEIKKAIVSANSHRWQQVIKECSDSQYNDIVQTDKDDDDDDEEDYDDAAQEERGRDVDNDKTKKNNGEGNDKKNDEKKDKKTEVKNEKNNKKRNKDVKKNSNKDSSEDDVDDNTGDSYLENNKNDAAGNGDKDVKNDKKKDINNDKNKDVKNDKKHRNKQDKDNKEGTKKDSSVDNKTTENKVKPVNKKQPDNKEKLDSNTTKDKQAALSSFGIFWQRIRGGHRASAIFKTLSTKPKPTKVSDVLDVYLTGTFGAGAIIDSWVPGLGKLFSSLVLASTKINYCLKDSAFRDLSSKLGSICSNKYGSDWGFKVESDISSYDDASDYITAYGLDDGLATFKRLLKTHTKSDLSGLVGSQKVVAQAIHDCFENGRFDTDYSWTKKDVTFVFSKVITVLGALGSSYNPKFGPSLVDELLNYSSVIGNESNGLVLIDLRQKIKKSISACQSHSWNNVINFSSDEEYSKRNEKNDKSTKDKPKTQNANNDTGSNGGKEDDKKDKEKRKSVDSDDDDTETDRSNNDEDKKKNKNIEKQTTSTPDQNNYRTSTGRQQRDSFDSDDEDNSENERDVAESSTREEDVDSHSRDSNSKKSASKKKSKKRSSSSKKSSQTDSASEGGSTYSRSGNSNASEYRESGSQGHQQSIHDKNEASESITRNEDGSEIYKKEKTRAKSSNKGSFRNERKSVKGQDGSNFEERSSSYSSSSSSSSSSSEYEQSNY